MRSILDSVRKSPYETLLFPIIIVFLHIAVGWALYSNGHFLGDQNDMLQQLFALFRGEMWALYGPYMSQTDPVVRNAGPVGAIFTAWLPALGFSWKSGKIFYILFLTFSTLALYFSIRRISSTVAILWCILYTVSPLHSWLFSFQWVNLYLAPLSLLFFSIYLSSWRRSTVIKRRALLLLMILSLHIHTSGILLLPFCIDAFLIHKRRANRMGGSVTAKKSEFSGNILVGRSSFYIRWAVTIVLVLSTLPYFAAELYYKWGNIKSFVINIAKGSEGSGVPGLLFALDTPFQMVGSTYRNLLFPGGVTLSSAIGWFVLISIIYFITPHIRFRTPGYSSQMVFSMAASVAFAGIYLLTAGRGLQGFHYSLPLHPLALIPSALFLSFIIKRSAKFTGEWRGLQATILILMLTVPFSMRLYSDRNPWSYELTEFSLRSACLDAGGSVDLFENGPFRGNPRTPVGVLEYHISKVSECDLVRGSKHLLFPDIDGDLKTSISLYGNQYQIVRSYTPGIGLYKKHE